MVTPFDPTSAPLLGVDHHLPALDPQHLSPQHLRERFRQGLEWAPERLGDRLPTSGASTPASVLVPLVMRGRLSVLLTQRTSHLSAHAGQISFPGGRQEPHDRDAVATALRESEEEVGLSAERVEVLGTLHDYTTVTGFVVTPVVALVSTPLDLRPDPHEVAEIFEVPLDFLMAPAHHQRRGLEIAGLRHEFIAMPWRPEPPAERPEYFIWGATAAILRNLYRFLSLAEPPPPR